MRKYFISLLLGLLIIGNDMLGQKIEIAPLDVNSSYDDFAPALVRNGRFMYFTSDRDDDRQRVYEVERTSGGWDIPEEMDDAINDGIQNGAVAMTPNGQYIIFAAYEHSEGTIGRTDLYSARKVYGDWEQVTNLGEDVNTEYWDSQPSLSVDGRTLYFVSNRPGGKGGIDIYISKRNKDGSWGKAKNAGSTINTKHDDMAPVILADNKSFTFASNKPGGHGGFDIYHCRVSGNSFSDLKNIGMPINSKYDDFFYHTVANSQKSYFTSNRKGSEGQLDLFMAIPYVDDGSKKKVIDLNDSELEIIAYDDEVVYENYNLSKVNGDPVYIVNGKVYDKETNEPLGADIIVTDLRTGQMYADFRSDDITGDYFVVLQPGRDYSITAQKDGYLFVSDIYELSDADGGKEAEKDMMLSPLEGGHTRLLIFFDFDKKDLKDQSIPELERVIEFLKENSDVRIMIEGHTDDVGGDDYNDKLSKDRAEAVKKYIVDAGIGAGRIETTGFGKREPLVEGKSDEARAMNRRVEMRIL